MLGAAGRDMIMTAYPGVSHDGVSVVPVVPFTVVPHTAPEMNIDKTVCNEGRR